MKKATRTTLGAASLAAALAAAALGAGPATAHSGSGTAGHRGQGEVATLRAQLSELNGSGASGRARAVVQGTTIRWIDVRVRGLDPDMPHAQHIHYGDDARNECPSLFRDDADRDGLLSTVEGVPAYGPIVVSLTTTGDTSPGSGLDVSRFPSSSDGSYRYSRRGIGFTEVAGTGYTGGTGTARQIAEAVRDGEGVVVIHGVDHNGNGRYDGEARSELDSDLPREATDPAACGVLR